MKLHSIRKFAWLAGFLGCGYVGQLCAASAETEPASSSQADKLTATKWRTTMVTAVGTSKPGSIYGVSEHFTFNGRIYAHVTLVAEGPVIAAPTTFTFKWFNADKQVHERPSLQTVNGSPYYLVHSMPGSVVGVGRGRVELHSAEGMLAARDFTVSER